MEKSPCVRSNSQSGSQALGLGRWQGFEKKNTLTTVTLSLSQSDAYTQSGSSRSLPSSIRRGLAVPPLHSSTSLFLSSILKLLVLSLLTFHLDISL
ncbi:hypothetical protein QQF64_024966 [Cirrhinus molitorella]|uniref:Uncharacterized protein n=1 Tax=Cirrhinus molitorella TaxID=172907 RepID=A0ABR3NMT0_9TELE